MGILRPLIDRIWSRSPERVAAAASWLPSARCREILSYRSSFVKPGPQFRCWWSPTLTGNLGDMLTPILISRLFGLVPIFCPRQSFLGVGSVVHKARAGTVVWGSGLIAPDAVDHPDARYLAVRGPLTRDILLRRGRDVPAIYGDPALLLPLVHQPDIAVEYELGLIPHKKHLPRIRGLSSDVLLIDFRTGSVNEVLACINQIARCKVIASSSLHGLILALTYGRKIIWLRDGTDQLTGDTFKFEDFFAALGTRIAPVEWSPDHPMPLADWCPISASVPDHMAHGLVDAFRSHLAQLSRC